MIKGFILLAAAAIAAAPASNFTGAPVVSVALSDYRFTPPDVRLAPGKPMILRLSNSAQQPHEFAAPAFFKAATIRPGDARLINKEGEVELAPGQRVDIHLMARPGTYDLRCNKPGHAAMGMRGAILVK